MLISCIAMVMIFSMAAWSVRAETLNVSIVHVTRDADNLRPLSLLDPVLTDEGLAGARLGIEDNQTTGSFLGHQYQLDSITLAQDADLAAMLAPVLAKGIDFIVADLKAEDLLALADLDDASEALIFNARATDDELRIGSCRANIFHLIPSRAMKTDGLAQYLVWKRWRDWLLVHGVGDGDLAFKASLERAAIKFGAKIVDTLPYSYEAKARRSDSGHVQIQKQIPVVTQGAADHDVLIVADESDIFGEYMSYRTSTPRPIAGTQGLQPTAWHRAHEQWGGTQMQNRFQNSQGRWMTERDYASWLAVRSLGEAVTRTESVDPAALRDYLRSEAFEIGGFKGQGLTFRPWNQQMRQPILLVGPRMLVSVSPQDGFLHQNSPLDTMGYDAPEASCDLSS